MKKLLVFIFTLYSFLLGAQDFAINMYGDTLRGKVSILGYDILDRVQINDGKKKNQLSVLQTKSVQIGKDTYHPVKGENGFRFMRLVRPGPLSLYLARKPQAGNVYEDEYLVKSDGSAMQVPNLAFKKIMLSFLEDCATLEEKITTENLGKKNLELIISYYNLCITNQTNAIKPTPSVDSGDARLVALNALRGKIEKSQLASKKDALDILTDITDKVKNNGTVPNYQLDGLKATLKDTPEFQADLDAVLSLLTAK